MAGQISVHTGLELEGVHGHFRPQGEAWELETELGLDQQAACDWDPCGEIHSGKPEWGKEACTYCCMNMGEGKKIISLGDKTKKHTHVKFIFREHFYKLL